MISAAGEGGNFFFYYVAALSRQRISHARRIFRAKFSRSVEKKKKKYRFYFEWKTSMKRRDDRSALIHRRPESYGRVPSIDHVHGDIGEIMRPVWIFRILLTSLVSRGSRSTDFRRRKIPPPPPPVQDCAPLIRGCDYVFRPEELALTKLHEPSAPFVSAF